MLDDAYHMFVLRHGNPKFIPLLADARTRCRGWQGRHAKLEPVFSTHPYGLQRYEQSFVIAPFGVPGRDLCSLADACSRVATYDALRYGARNPLRALRYWLLTVRRAHQR